MADKQRALTIADIAAVAQCAAASLEPRAVYREVERISGETIGWRLFTILRYVESRPGRRAPLLQRRGGLSHWWPQAARQDQRQPRRACHGRSLLGGDQAGGAQGLLRPRADLFAWHQRHSQRADPACRPTPRHRSTCAARRGCTARPRSVAAKILAGLHRAVAARPRLTGEGNLPMLVG